METARVRTVDKREQILQATLKLFSSEGFFNTSIHDIRREADVSIGSIYHYFTNKETLARALYDELVDEMLQTIRSIILEQDTCRERSRAIMRFFFSWTDSNPLSMHYIMYARHQEFMPEAKPICSSEPFFLVFQVVGEGIEQGEVRAVNPAVATTSLFGGAIRLIHLYLDGSLEGPVEQYFEETWQCGWRSVAAPASH